MVIVAVVLAVADAASLGISLISVVVGVAKDSTNADVVALVFVLVLFKFTLSFNISSRRNVDLWLVITNNLVYIPDKEEVDKDDVAVDAVIKVVEAVLCVFGSLPEYSWYV